MKKLICHLPLFILFIISSCTSCEKASSETTSDNTDLIAAVPFQATLVLEVPSWKKFNTDLHSSSYWTHLNKAYWNTQLDDFTKDISNIFLHDELDQSAILSISLYGKQKFHSLFLTHAKADITQYKTQLSAQFNVSSSTYDKVELCKLVHDQKVFYFSVYQDIFLLSSEKLLLEEGLRQLNAKVSLRDDTTFDKLYRASNTEKSPYLFIHYKDGDQLVQSHLKDLPLAWLKHVADWSALELNFDAHSLAFKGVTATDHTKAHFLSIFKDATPAKKELLQHVPSSVDALCYLSWNDYSDYITLYDKYLDNSQQLIYKQQRLETQPKNKAWIERGKQWIGNELCLLFFSNPRHPRADQLLLIQLKETTQAQEALNEIADSIETYRAFAIQQFQRKYLLQDLLGNYVDDLVTPYYIIFDQVAVFSENLETLKAYIDDKLLSRFLLTNDTSKNFIAQFDESAHFFIYSKGSGIQLLAPYFKQPFIKKFVMAHDFEVVQHAGIQFQFDGNAGFTQGFFSIEKPKESEQEISKLWQLTLPSDLNIYAIVTNHKTKEKEIAVQDETYTLHLISAQGKTLWNRALNEPILGSIQQLDIYHNGRLQLVFNTASKLYIIDRNGKDVAPFPFTFKSAATNGLGLFDYDNTQQNYRLLVPQGNRLNMYNQQGKPITGFVYTPSENIATPPLHHRYGNQDYIFITTLDGKIHLLDRHGKEYTPWKDSFKIATDQSLFLNKETVDFISNEGKWVHFNPKTGTIKSDPIDKEALKVTLTPDGLLEQYSDHIAIHKLSYNIDDSNQIVAKYYTDKKKRYVILIDNTLHQIKLIDENQEVVEGTPIYGGYFAEIYRVNSAYFLLTSSKEKGSLINYRLK